MSTRNPTPNLTPMDKYNKAKAMLMVSPETSFYASLFLRRKVYFDHPQVSTAAVDAAGNMFFNMAFVDSLTVKQVLFLIVHELEHLLRMHPQRLAERDAKKWNRAGDACINDQLRHDHIGQWIDGGVDEHGAREKTTDELYNALPPDSDNPDNPTQGDGGDGIGDDLLSGDASGGDDKPMTPDQIRQAEAHIKSDIAAAAQEARVAGNMSSELQRRVDQILHVRTPWYTILERFMQSRAKTDYSWSRPNRRMVANGTYLPSLDSVARLGTVVLGIDTSISISEHEADVYASHVNRIMESCMPERVHVMYCDTYVQKHDTYEADELPVKIESYRGGGTDLRAIFTTTNTLPDDIAACIVFTDGHTPWPDAPQDYPVLIVCTTDVGVSYGDEVIRFNIDN